ncbi:MAG: hypothetical protein ACRDQZ_08320 [Mycobacteriales bacterium]
MRNTAGDRGSGARRSAWRLWGLGFLAVATLGVTGHAEPSALVRPDRGWTVTMYYTAVESYHHGPAERVAGSTAGLRARHRRSGDLSGRFPPSRP